MDEVHKEALKKSLHLLVRDIDPNTDIVNNLISKDILNPRDMNEIMGGSKTTRQQQNRRLLNILLTRGPNAFDGFTDALKLNHLDHLVKVLDIHVRSATKPDTHQTLDSEDNNQRALQILKNDRLTENLVDLCEKMNSQEVIPRLQERKIITDVEAKTIREEKTTYTRNQTIIVIVKNRAAFDTFVIILEETQQQNLANQLRGKTTMHHIALAAKSVQDTLRQMYLISFKKTHPFSFPFTFDIEQTWVSLMLRDDENSQATDNYNEFLFKAFKNEVKMLVIEGRPATGKTSLMRRIAYDWANGVAELEHYDIVLYSEFRKLPNSHFDTIVDLVMGYLGSISRQENFEEVNFLMKNKDFLKKHRVLLLLDGYDECTVANQCKELHDILNFSVVHDPLLFYVVVSTRPGYLSMFRGLEGRFVFADVLGFTTDEQKEKYILNYFSADSKLQKIEAVQRLIKSNNYINTMAEVPIFLLFICLVHERIIDGTIIELYCKIIWWFMDRHQKDYLDRDVPDLFGFQEKLDNNKFRVIQNNYFYFPQLHLLGAMALHNEDKTVFCQSDLNSFKIDNIVQEVGLLRKDESRDDFFNSRLDFLFPHRTIQEFLAALSFFFSSDLTVHETVNKLFHPIILEQESAEQKMNEFEMFLWRIASSKQLPINPSRQSNFFASYSKLILDVDIFISSFETSIEHLNICLAKCSNVTILYLYSQSNCLIINKSVDLTNLTKIEHFYFSRYLENSLPDEFLKLKLPISSDAFLPPESFVLLPQKKVDVHLRRIEFWTAELFRKSMEYLSNFCKLGSKMEFDNVTVQSRKKHVEGFTVSIEIENLPKKTVSLIFEDYDLNEAMKYVSGAKWLTIVKPRKTVGTIDFQHFKILQDLNFTKLNFTLFSPNLTFANLPSLINAEFEDCNIPENAKLTFKNAPEMFRLTLKDCKILAHSLLNFATLPALRTFELQHCDVDITAWESITEEISKSSVRYMRLSLDFFHGHHTSELLVHLQKCEVIEQLLVTCRKEDEVIWISFEDKFTDILKSLALSMGQLQLIELDFYFEGKLDKTKEELIKSAGRKRTPGIFDIQQSIRL